MKAISPAFTKSESRELDILDLKECPQWLELVGFWLSGQWPDQGGHEARCDALRSHLREDTFPLTLVLTQASQPVGCASITRYWPSGEPSFATHWVTNVFVPEQHRGRGYGRLLVRALESKARREGVEQLFLSTEDQVAFYRQLGWEFVRRSDLESGCVSVLRRRL